MGIAERKGREKEQRRNDIIDAAEKVFFSKGIERATMDDVAEAVELSKGTLYLYFKSKEELFLAIHLRGNKILKSMFEEVFDKFESGLDKVRALGDTYLEYYKKYPDYFSMMLYYEAIEIENFDKNSLAYECVDEGDKVLLIVCKALEIGITDGSIRKDIDPCKIAVILWGQTTGLIQILMRKGEIIEQMYKLNSEEVINYSFDLMRDFLRKK